jgi:hypothetical protein
MKHFLLAAAAVMVVSAAGHSVSHGTSVLFASNVATAESDNGNGGPDLRNRETAQQVGTDRHNVQMAESDNGNGGLDLRNRETA